MNYKVSNFKEMMKVLNKYKIRYSISDLIKLNKILLEVYELFKDNCGWGSSLCILIYDTDDAHAAKEDHDGRIEINCKFCRYHNDGEAYCKMQFYRDLIERLR
jgi:hypothetical protein